MKKMMLIFGVIAILISNIIIGVAFTIKPIRLIVNEKERTPSIPLQIINGKTVQVIRDVAEALDASVRWDSINKVITITNKNKQLLEQKEQLFENAFALDTPDEIANNWAKGVMSRNGAWQYALLCDELKKKMLADFVSFDWVTGVSSPWIDSFKITNKKVLKDNTLKYTIKFHYTDSTGSSTYSTSNIIIGKNHIGKIQLPIYPPDIENKWCIIDIE